VPKETRENMDVGKKKQQKGNKNYYFRSKGK